jgi:hypothetical protein
LVETADHRGALALVDFVVKTKTDNFIASSVYTAGPHHAVFSLSLTNVYKDDFTGSADFARVEGIPVRILWARYWRAWSGQECRVLQLPNSVPLLAVAQPAS